MGNGFDKSDYMYNPLALHFYSVIANGRKTIDAGVTFIRDCGPADLGVKMAQQKGLFVAPKMQIAITPLECTGGHFDLYLLSGIDVSLQYPGVPIGRCDVLKELLRKFVKLKEWMQILLK